ncbi:MAG: polysaccharide deacetylase family protein [Ktedonobacteraceae bacterium]|nr:polysaccharide deacetylase family protein [Ktedonobacteraceae bacterium]
MPFPYSKSLKKFAFLSVFVALCITLGVGFAPEPSAMASTVSSAAPNQGRVILRGRSDVPKIAFTFDDGPHPINTPKILAILRQYHVPATFFTEGRYVQQYPWFVKQELAAGHIVGNHTWDHPELPTLSPQQQTQEIASTSAMMRQMTGVTPPFLRPPYGELDEPVKQEIVANHLSTVLWDIDPRDWSCPGIESIINTVLSNAHHGAIVLMHDGGGDRSQTVAALPEIIQGLRQRGYTLVTISPLLR